MKNTCILSIQYRISMEPIKTGQSPTDQEYEAAKTLFHTKNLDAKISKWCLSSFKPLMTKLYNQTLTSLHRNSYFALNVYEIHDKIGPLRTHSLQFSGLHVRKKPTWLIKWRYLVIKSNGTWISIGRPKIGKWVALRIFFVFCTQWDQALKELTHWICVPWTKLDLSVHDLSVLALQIKQFFIPSSGRIFRTTTHHHELVSEKQKN